MKLKDRVAVVTGGGRGIGKAICLAFAEEGAHLVVAADIEEEIRDVASAIEKAGQKALSQKVDVTNPAEIDQLVEKAIKHFGKVDVLVNNAGIVGKRSFLHQSDDHVWRKTIEVNLFGTYFCTKAFLSKMIDQQEGRIINIASISGKQASPTNSAYCASKHGIIGITRTVAAELGLLGLAQITANAICPGVANTDMLTGKGMILDELAALLGSTREAVLEEKIKPMSIQQRIIDPEEIARMAVYLASDDARGITGQAVNVCAGSVFY